MARFFIAQRNLRENEGLITGQELQHLSRALRLGPGDPVTFFDESGREYEGVIRSVTESVARIEILRSYEVNRESPLEVTLAAGLTKGDKMDLVVEKATELGVRTVVPFVSNYTVPKLDPEKMAKRSRRWRKIALNAAKQCGRTRVPAIGELCDFRELVKQPTEGALRLLFWERAARQTLNQVHSTESAVQAVLAVVGPEGGLSVDEANLAEAHGFKLVGLGHRVLRAETAAVAVMSLVQFLWGDLS